MLIGVIIRPVDAMHLEDLPASNDPTARFAHRPASITSLPITVFPIPGEAELSADRHETPRIFVAHAGWGRRWYQMGSVTRALTTRPRMIEIYEGGLTFEHCRWEGEPGRCVMVEFGDSDVQTLTHGEVDGLALRTQHEIFDDRVSDIALLLAQEALHDLPNGRLYVQGLCVALLGVLESRYTSAAARLSTAGAGQLGPVQRRRLLELIQGSLGADLSLTELAETTGLSVHHFSRVFKATFGTTPHRYVQRRRIDAAVAALRAQEKRPIADIALELGFASQAHMTELMRRQLGVTPRVVRRGT
jgi:AraC family transcriptional regulator